MLANDVFDKGLMCKMYKELIQLNTHTHTHTHTHTPQNNNNNNNNNLIKMAEYLNKHFSKEDIYMVSI